MAEIVKYKYFYSTEDFEQWQQDETPMRIHSVVPTFLNQETKGIADPISGSINTITVPILAVFVTYVDYDFPAGEGHEE